MEREVWKYLKDIYAQLSILEGLLNDQLNAHEFLAQSVDVELQDIELRLSKLEDNNTK